MASFLLAIIVLIVIIPLFIYAIYTVHYHVKARRIGIHRENWLPPIPFLNGVSKSGFDQRRRGRFAGDVDEAWDLNVGDDAEYEGVGLQDHSETRHSIDDAELDRRFDQVVAEEEALQNQGNPFGSGARKISSNEGHRKEFNASE